MAFQNFGRFAIKLYGFRGTLCGFGFVITFRPSRTILGGLRITFCGFGITLCGFGIKLCDFVIKLGCIVL